MTRLGFPLWSLLLGFLCLVLSYRGGRGGVGVASDGLSSNGVTVALSSVAEAQRCPRRCAQSERDARGCCPALGRSGSSGSRGRGPAGNHRWGGLPECADGLVTGGDAAGHCCWPGQAWVPSQHRCVGRPQCPSGLVAESGGDCGCAVGMVRNADTRDHCCWPGQYWLESTGACGGPPSCPLGTQPLSGGCGARACVAQAAFPAESERQRELEREVAARIAESQRDLEHIRAEYAQAMENAERGICSRCHRPAHQIEHDEGVTFAAHLRATTASVEPVSAESLAQLRGDYEGRLQDLQAMIVQAEAEICTHDR